MRKIQKAFAAVLTLALLLTFAPVEATAQSSSKTHVSDTLTDASGAPLSGKVTFVLTRQSATSPDGLVVASPTVSATLDMAGKFDVWVYPSASLTPASYYQVYATNGVGSQTFLGVYNIPSSATVVSLSPYKVTDANLAAQYTFAQQAAVLALSSTISTATFQSLLSASHDTKLQKYDATNHTLADSALSESSTAVVSTKKITATAFEGNCAGCTGLTGATGGVANTGSTTIGGDTDGDGVGGLAGKIKHATSRRLNNDGTTDFYAAARINGQAIVTTDDQRLSDAATLRNGVIDRGTSVRAFGDSQTAIKTARKSKR